MIDINTGSFTGRGKGRLEDTITKVNVEAADEVVRQLRLRDIGGIIVIDFIDMAKAKNRDQVLKILKKALDADKTKSYVMEVSPLGLVEMTRQNVTDGVREILTHVCPTCDGEGVVRSAETVAIEVHPQAARARRRGGRARGVPDQGQRRTSPPSWSPTEAAWSSSRSRPASTSTSRAARRSRSTPTRSSTAARATDIEERALPFRVGEEVLVTIEEPHMYDADDAIARVDSYIVSVGGGGSHVGERRLVRIESVARSAATAALLDENGDENREARIAVLRNVQAPGPPRRQAP